ncbi:MAG: glycosyltransferase family 2 protein [Geminocystis sp.]|nr:glycosyltransferase family 2 protein [Geminocystis sp.]HIK38822.1 glycosyltransferase family 2 protein [Geminocystis sp. M7585_C2015_104]MCS7146552.1 glycosyltransferase family 2 protein [Geminocystis sp.]MCX8078627.1 glycosyltransferase family 2 protein [Geminocystis sp.]MDW8117329.1 glycosyltransferase family A protein [Geminocystis sp.]
MVPISVCIPTKDRPEELKKCIDSVLAQTTLPREIVIIDDGQLDVAPLREVIELKTGFKYFKKDKPSLSASRNLAKEIARSELILFLDDDVVLEPDYIQNIYKVFEEDVNREIGAVGGIEINSKRESPLAMFYKRLFFLHCGKPGVIMPWGFQTGAHGIDTITQVMWLTGAISCFRKELLIQFPFEEFHGGRNALEDIEFAWRVWNKYKGQKYKFLVNPHARAYHYHSPVSREKSYVTGYKQAYNRLWIFNKHGEKTFQNITLFCWAMTGQILKMAATGRIEMAIGSVRGIISFLTGK